MSLTIRPGGFCDVTAYGPDFAFVYGKGTALTCEVAGRVAWTATLPEPCLFWRIAASPSGSICAAAQGQSGYLVVVVDGKLVDTGSRRTFGVTPTAVQWSVGGQCFAIAYQTSSSTYRVWHVGTSVTTTTEMPPTSQGFRDWPPGGPLVRSDDAFKTTRNGWTFYEPNVRGDVLVGQTDPPAIRVALPDRVFTAIPNDGFEPHLAVNNGKIAVCARTPKGAALAIINQPWPADERPPVVPPPVIPPPVEPPPVTEPNVAAAKAAILASLNAAGLKAVDGGGNDATRERTTDALCRAITEVRKTDSRWGMLLKTSGNRWKDRAVDIATMLDDGVLYHWDVVQNGEGDGGSDPKPVWRYVGVLNVNRFALPYELGTVPPPVEPPPVVTPPTSDLEKRLLALEVQMANVLPLLGAHAAGIGALTEQVNDVESQIGQVVARLGQLRVKGNTGRTWSHGHEINLKVEG